MKKILLLSYLSLSSALMISNGTYNHLALLFVATSFILLLFAAWRYLRGGEDSSIQSLELPLIASLLFSLGFRPIKPVGEPSYLIRYEQLGMVVVGLAALGILFWYIFRERSRIRAIIFIALAVMPIILWLLVPWASPKPRIDVYKFHQKAAAYVVDGVNPYSVIIGIPSHFSKSNGYTYPPANLYPLAFSFFLTGDVRYAQAVLMVMTALLLWLVARRTVGGIIADLLTLLFLYHPRGIFVLERSWTETIIIFPFALFLFLSVYKLFPAVAAFVYGYFLSLKPYLAFLLFPWLIIERRPRYLFFGLCGAAIPIIPFVASDFAGTIYSGFFFVLQNVPFRADSLSISSLLFELCDTCSIPWFGLSLPVGAISTALTLWFFRRHLILSSYLFVVTIIMFSIFFLGSLAFVSYYYLVSVMLLFLIPVVVQVHVKSKP